MNGDGGTARPCGCRVGSEPEPGAGAESVPGHSRRHGHVPGSVVAAVAAAFRRDADVQPAARLHRVAHDPGRAAGLCSLRLLPHGIPGAPGTGEGLGAGGARCWGAGNRSRGVLGGEQGHGMGVGAQEKVQRPGVGLEQRGWEMGAGSGGQQDPVLSLNSTTRPSTTWRTSSSGRASKPRYSPKVSVVGAQEGSGNTSVSEGLWRGWGCSSSGTGRSQPCPGAVAAPLELFLGLGEIRGQPCSAVCLLALHSPHLPPAGSVRLRPHPPRLCDHLVCPELPWRLGSDHGDPRGSWVTLGKGQDCQGAAAQWDPRGKRCFRKGRGVGSQGRCWGDPRVFLPPAAEQPLPFCPRSLIFSMVGLYYINKISSTLYQSTAPVAAPAKAVGKGRKRN